MSQYDPNKNYSWNPEDKFEITGKEFMLMLNTVRSVLSTEEAAKIMLAQQANSSLEMVLARAVEKGTAKEMVKEPNDYVETDLDKDKAPE